MKKYDIYILRCEGNTYYTGIAIDYQKRYLEHLEGRGAKYTKSRKPISVEAVWEAIDRSEASKVEHFIKSKVRRKKEKYIYQNQMLVDEIDRSLNIKINIKKAD